MTRPDPLDLSKAIEEAERERDEVRETLELLKTPGLKLTAEGEETFAAGIAIVKQRLAEVEASIQKLRRKQFLRSARFRLRRFAPPRSAQG